MTDRRTGGFGAQADIRATPERRTGALGVMVDVRVQEARSVPIAAALSGSAQRSIPATGVFAFTGQRSIPLSAALRATASRSIPTTVRLSVTATRSIPLGAQFVTGGGAATYQRSIPLSAIYQSALTDRRTGGLGVTADIQAEPLRRTGAVAVVVDVVAPATVVVTSERSFPFDAMFEEGELPEPEPGVPPAATISSTRKIPLSVQISEGLTVPLSMPVASAAPPTDYEYVWSVPSSGPDCIDASVSIPSSISDLPVSEGGADEDAIYVQIELSGTAPEGARFGAFASLHSVAYGWQRTEALVGYASWNPWTSREISSWQNAFSLYGILDGTQVQVAPADHLEGGYSATACFTWRSRAPDPDPPPCELVQLTTEWYRTSVSQHVSPPVPYDSPVPVPATARRFRVWYLPFEGDTSSAPTVAVRNSTIGTLSYVKDSAVYSSPAPSHYISEWLDPQVPGVAQRMTGLEMRIMTDDDNQDSIPFHQGQQMGASVIIEWDCENSVGIPISGMFERRPPGVHVQIVG